MAMSKAQLSNEVLVIDTTTGTETKYHAIKAAAKALGIDKRYIEQYIYLNQENPVLDRYIFKLTENAERKLPISQPAINIAVTDLKLNQKTIYPSIGLAARAIGERQSSISIYLSKERTMPFKQQYIIKKIDEGKSQDYNKKTTISVIEVTDLTAGGTKTNYYSITAAAKALDVPYSSITHYLNTNSDKSYKNKYLFKKLTIGKEN